MSKTTSKKRTAKRPTARQAADAQLPANMTAQEKVAVKHLLDGLFTLGPVDDPGTYIVALSALGIVAMKNAPAVDNVLRSAARHMLGLRYPGFEA